MGYTIFRGRNTKSAQVICVSYTFAIKMIAINQFKLKWNEYEKIKNAFNLSFSAIN